MMCECLGHLYLHVSELFGSISKFSHPCGHLLYSVADKCYIIRIAEYPDLVYFTNSHASLT